MNKTSLAIFALALGTLLLSMASVMACSCIPPRDVQTELNDSYAVFQGKVVDMERPAMSIDYDVTFEVNTSWKGVNESIVTAKTAQDSAACGYPFETNKTYLVYAVQFEEETWIYSCGRTSLLEDAQADIPQLGEPIWSASTIGDRDADAELSIFTRIRMWFSKLFN